MDTSAFLKLLIQESGSERMLQFWLAEDNRNMVVSAIAQTEARSAICRLRNEGRIVPDEANFAFASITAEIRRLIEQPVNPPVLDAANGLIDKHNLRTLDAVQLASAVVVRSLMSAPEMRFVASDHALLIAAEQEGFGIWNPCK
ncbi:type II toxin-antitoxin system VapC family toxin [Granulicella aggregans]|uniref:type II toxin-antitoxin system VapC family toxin n=1 Tax=Granulicella aggregans TaxID=474949 RepID=UPI0021E05A9E|nr:type II toxin-antitoxin system VapC family toxin [Granulicella aggregans]